MNASGSIARARTKIRDESSEFFTSDTPLLRIINDINEEVWSTLQFCESNLIYGHTTVTTSTGTTASTAEVSLSITHAGILRDGVSRVGYTEPLYAVMESDKKHFNVDGPTGTAVTGIPSAYYLTAYNSTMGFLVIPDDPYTFNVYYWKELTELPSVGTAMLFDGIFNSYITAKLVVELLEIMERDNSRASILAQIEHDKAMQRVYAIGLRPKRVMSDMFSVDGI